MGGEGEFLSWRRTKQRSDREGNGLGLLTRKWSGRERVVPNCRDGVFVSANWESGPSLLCEF
ncbi:hypothetical protein MA16_Dca010427 [Dendrobium catenatum]|uniref:Uncharacterized protein n=1 Tax=Dendrobium catenatum TaxID=906689 RepID=A0A2I0XBG6_9ASPA|nr:hypothetical protein MA16_Dca010427 [Dendrobium catenatum]